MKIALVSQEYPPETARGGIGSQTYMKAHGLSAKGHEIFVISRSIDAERHESSSGNITVVRIPGMEALISDMSESVQWITHSVVIAAELKALHDRVILDIVDFPEWAAEGYVHLLNRNEWNYVPAVIQLHGPLVMFAHTMGWPDIKSEFYRVGFQMEAMCVQLADGIYSSSKCSADWIINHYSPGKDSIPVIHLGIDTKIFKPLPIDKFDRTTIIFTGKLVPNKGVEELVEAACRLKLEFPDLRLRLIGNSSKEYLSVLAEKDPNDLLEFTGYLNKEDMPRELSQAHIFAAPSYYEGGPGFVYLEAMACGLPVIGCTGSGVDEIITQGENGLLVSPGDIDSLTVALRMLLLDKNLREHLGSKAREFILQEANSDHCINELENFYESVIQIKANTKNAEKINTHLA